MNEVLLKEDTQSFELIETIVGWPKWKKDSVCIDKSDIILFERINDIYEISEDEN